MKEVIEEQEPGLRSLNIISNKQFPMITGGARVALQDSIRLPLKGETPKVRYERFIPRRPKTTMLIIGAFIGSTIYGIYNYRIGKSIRQYGFDVFLLIS